MASSVTRGWANAAPTTAALSLRVAPATTGARRSTAESTSSSQPPEMRSAVRAALAGRDVDVVLRRFDPASLPTLYLPDPNADGRAVAAAASDGADELWSEVLGAMSGFTPATAPQLVLNYDNPLIRRLIVADRDELTRDIAGGLYVQALLAGRHPLRPADTALLNSSFLNLIDRAVEQR
mgnify:CR=1 FL=1